MIYFFIFDSFALNSSNYYKLDIYGCFFLLQIWSVFPFRFDNDYMVKGGGGKTFLIRNKENDSFITTTKIVKKACSDSQIPINTDYHVKCTCSRFIS